MVMSTRHLEASCRVARHHPRHRPSRRPSQQRAARRHGRPRHNLKHSFSVFAVAFSRNELADPPYALHHCHVPSRSSLPLPRTSASRGPVAASRRHLPRHHAPRPPPALQSSGRQSHPHTRPTHPRSHPHVSAALAARLLPSPGLREKESTPRLSLPRPRQRLSRCTGPQVAADPLRGWTWRTPDCTLVSRDKCCTRTIGKVCQSALETCGRCSIAAPHMFACPYPIVFTASGRRRCG